MIQVPLNAEERRILMEIMESVHSDLRMEIAGTDTQDFRDMLKRRKEVVKRVLDAARLSDDGSAPAGAKGGGGRGSEAPTAGAPAGQGEAAPAADPTGEESKAVVRRFYEAVNGKAKPEEVLVDFVSDPGLRGHVLEFEAAFPRYRLEVEEMIAEGDRVVIRGIFQGTHQGPLGELPATGRSATVPLMVMYRVADGKIEEAWVATDRLELMDQLGVS